MTALSNIPLSSTLGKGLALSSSELRSEYQIITGTLVKLVTSIANGGTSNNDPSQACYFFRIFPSDLGLTTFKGDNKFLQISNGDLNACQRNFNPKYYEILDAVYVSLQYVDTGDYDKSFTGLVRVNYVYIGT